MAPEKFVVGLRCAGPVAEAATAGLVDVVWMAWLQAGGGAAPPAAGGTTGEDGPREHIVALLQELLKQQLVGAGYVSSSGYLPCLWTLKFRSQGRAKMETACRMHVLPPGYAADRGPQGCVRRLPEEWGHNGCPRARSGTARDEGINMSALPGRAR